MHHAPGGLYHTAYLNNKKTIQSFNTQMPTDPDFPEGDLQDLLEEETPSGKGGKPKKKAPVDTWPMPARIAKQKQQEKAKKQEKEIIKKQITP